MLRMLSNLLVPKRMFIITLRQMWAMFKGRYKSEAAIKNIAYESQKPMTTNQRIDKLYYLTVK